MTFIYNMHWVYILQCGEKNNKIYIGETKRLYTRIKEHCKKNTGSVTTHFFYPNQIIGLYKLENATKTSALDLENTITEMYMQYMGSKWENVFGGKYHVGFRPYEHPSANKEFSRPFCDCGVPADKKEFNDKKYWRCAKKNIWNGLQEYVTNELEFESQHTCEPCRFYKELY